MALTSATGTMAIQIQPRPKLTVTSQALIEINPTPKRQPKLGRATPLRDDEFS